MSEEKIFPKWIDRGFYATHEIKGDKRHSLGEVIIACKPMEKDDFRVRVMADNHGFFLVDIEQLEPIMNRSGKSYKRVK